MPNSTYKKWKNTSIKYTNEIQNLDFLNDCVYFNLIPKFLSIRNKSIRKLFPWEVGHFERTLLKNMINKKKRKSFNLLSKVQEYRNDMKSKCSHADFSVYQEKITLFQNKRKRMLERRHHNKLQHWLKPKSYEILKNYQPINNEYINLTDKVFDTHTDTILKLGPKFILNEPFNEKDLIASIESAIAFLPNDIADQTREFAYECITKFKKRGGNRQNKEDFLDRKCLEELKKDRSITCLKTDKTGKICIMPRSLYNQMIEDAIKKMDTQIIDINPLPKLIEKTKELIKNGKWIDDNQPKIDNHAPSIPRMFGNFKDHKDPPTMRPIVNRTEGPTKPIENYMKKIYQEILPPSENSLTSNEQFLKKLKEIQIDKNDILMSFDVKDLYPSINIKEITPIINNRIENYYEDKIIAQTLIRANNLLLSENYFTFNQKIYQQKKGVPMGSCISGQIAELKMRLIEEEIMRLQYPIKLWVRYVDDVFCILGDNTNPNDLLKSLNKLDSNIQFTLETEKNNTINFLDVKIIRNNNNLDTTVYRKPTKTEEIIHNRCKTPFEYKMAALRSYVNRAILICSNTKLLNEEIENIEKIALKGGYDKNIVRKLYRNRMKKLNKIHNAQKPKKKFTSSIPHVVGVSTKIKYKSSNSGYVIPIKPNRNIFQRIRNEKDKINPLDSSGIYEISFNHPDKPDKFTYIGVTKRRISTRFKEHLRDIKLQKNTTAIAQHNLKDPIDINSMEVRRIAPYRNQHYAFNRETIEIITRDAINRHESSNIHAIWRKSLLTNERKTRR